MEPNEGLKVKISVIQLAIFLAFLEKLHPRALLLWLQRSAVEVAAGFRPCNASTSGAESSRLCE